MIPAYPTDLNDARLDATYGPGFATFVRLALDEPAEKILRAWCDTAATPCPRTLDPQASDSRSPDVRTPDPRTNGTNATGMSAFSSTMPSASFVTSTSVCCP